jgi:Zn-dependent protease with chaperone function
MPLAALLACAAYAVGAVCGWVVAAALAAPVANRSWQPAAKARLLAQLRTLPLTLAVITTCAQVSAFARFEVTRAESAGPLLLMVAALGLVLAVDGLWRAAQSWKCTVRLAAEWRAKALPLAIRNWTRPAWVFRPSAPVVAVVGALRPQLFVAQQVIDECTAAEITAIAAHEAAHVAAGDNLTRWLFVVTPGVRFLPKTAARIEQQWQAASEESADACASRTTGSLELASALTKVARLMLASPLSPMVASALTGVSNLDARVRRLLDSSPPSDRLPRLSSLPAVLLFGTAVVLQLPPVSSFVHELFEMLVRSR